MMHGWFTAKEYAAETGLSVSAARARLKKISTFNTDEWVPTAHTIVKTKRFYVPSEEERQGSASCEH